MLGRTIQFQQVLPTLRAALRDGDVGVRLSALDSLTVMGHEAFAAADDIMQLYHDTEPQVRFNADRALWEVNEPRALKAGDWQAFTSADWAFTADFPGEPDEDERPLEVSGGTIRLHVIEATPNNAPVRYYVAVTDYPAAAIKDTTEDQRLDFARERTVEGIGGKLRREVPVQVDNRNGREMVIEVSDVGVIRHRLIWQGRRLA